MRRLLTLIVLALFATDVSAEVNFMPVGATQFEILMFQGFIISDVHCDGIDGFAEKNELLCPVRDEVGFLLNALGWCAAGEDPSDRRWHVCEEWSPRFDAPGPLYPEPTPH